MTLTTIGIILFVVCAVWFGLVYYAVAILPSKIVSKSTHNDEEKQKKSLFTILRQFFYF